MKTIGIIGGGASGMMAAIAAAGHKDTRVFILEHKEKAGKKILSTGNGRCNLTNEKMDISCFRSDNLAFVRKVIEQFGYQDTLRFFEKAGLLTKSRGGYLYPACGQALAVLDVLCMELARLGIVVHTGVHVTGVTPTKKGFRISSDKKQFFADKVILATGSKAAKVLGSDGSGYELAKSVGHSIEPVVPALVSLKVEKSPLAKASGVRTDARVTVYEDGRKLAEDTGELQITTYGISGIPVFQISRYAAKSLYRKKQAQVEIDFFPAMEEEMFCRLLRKRILERNERPVCDCLTGIFHSKLIPVLLTLADIHMHTKGKELSEKEIHRLSQKCRHTFLTISDTNGFDNAQVCAGGVRLQEIAFPAMQSRLVKGLYLTGELLDVDGICGGYNLQWAWATGYLAGNHAAT